MLAGAERLDKELMIGQMQGKFQLVVLGGVGHMVQEVRFSLSCDASVFDFVVLIQDDPAQLAETLVEFWQRNERVTAGVKKVGEL